MSAKAFILTENSRLVPHSGEVDTDFVAASIIEFHDCKGADAERFLAYGQARHTTIDRAGDGIIKGVYDFTFVVEAGEEETRKALKRISRAKQLFLVKYWWVWQIWSTQNL